MTAYPSVYDDLTIQPVKIRTVSTGRRRADVYATLVINNKGRHLFRKAKIVSKIGPHEERQTSLIVWPFGPTKKEILMLKDTETPHLIKEAEMRILFFDPTFERGLSVGGKFFDIDFDKVEVERQ
jgi:hypothetical protein